MIKRETPKGAFKEGFDAWSNQAMDFIGVFNSWREPVGGKDGEKIEIHNI